MVEKDGLYEELRNYVEILNHVEENNHEFILDHMWCTKMLEGPTRVFPLLIFGKKIK